MDLLRASSGLSRRKREPASRSPAVLHSDISMIGRLVGRAYLDVLMSLVFNHDSSIELTQEGETTVTGGAGLMQVVFLCLRVQLKSCGHCWIRLIRS